MFRGPTLRLAGLALLSSIHLAAATVPTPTIEGPVTGGLGAPFVAATTFDLATVGYTAEEFFISGTASAFTNTAPLGTDGQWSVVPGESAAYKTRILVYRPVKKAKFNGTVVVEWLNVSGGLDSAPDWISGHVQLIRDGFAWVGVSVQKIGIEGGTPVLPGLPVLYLKLVDPVRYGSLVHPGDSFSYDIFSQAGQALRTVPDLLHGLQIKALLAVGESQSAFRMVDYINAIHPLAGVYDGYLVHSRGGGGVFGAPLSESPQPTIPIPGIVHIRTDVDVPVLTIQTETDVVFFGYALARQDDTDRIRLWEVPGTAHADTYTLVTGMTDLGDDPAIADVLITNAPGGFFTCPVAVNSGPLHFVLNAAFSALNRWVRKGTPPPIAARLEVTTSSGVVITRDAHGNALGGIRTPQLDVPIASYSGGGQSGSLACLLFGTTSLFDEPTLLALYPTHRTYVSAFRKATTAAVRSGFLLRRDARLLKAWAAASDVGK
jgi:Alpha/beta hydrolase domain